MGLQSFMYHDADDSHREGFEWAAICRLVPTDSASSKGVHRRSLNRAIAYAAAQAGRASLPRHDHPDHHAHSTPRSRPDGALRLPASHQR